MNPFKRRRPTDAPLEGERPEAAASTSADTREAASDEPITGDRGIPSVNRVRSIHSRVSSVLAVALMSVLGLGMLGWYYGRVLSRSAQTHDRAQAASRARAHGEMPLPPLGDLQPPPIASSPEPETVTVSATTAPTGTGKKTAGELAFERRLRGPAFARQAGASATPVSSIQTASADSLMPVSNGAGDIDGATSMGVVGASDSGSLASLLHPTVTRAARAQVLPTRRLLLPKGAFIDCTLETAIDSTLPGMTTCITATDTFSADGNVVLLERGTKLIGETRGEVRRGSARVFVLWSEARTPTGVVVPIASPGTDELGRSGLPGKVNRHFWERFGAAILVSVIDSAVQSAAQNRGSGGTVIVNPSRTSDVLTEILKGTIDIPPTVVKHQGDRIQVFVARDVDFRSVYELRPTADR